MWSLMCPNECPGLQDCWGEAFDKLYERYLTKSFILSCKLIIKIQCLMEGMSCGVDFNFVALDERVLTKDNIKMVSGYICAACGLNI